MRKHHINSHPNGILDPPMKPCTAWLVSYKDGTVRMFVMGADFTTEKVMAHDYVTAFGETEHVVNIVAGTWVLEPDAQFVAFGWTLGGIVYGGIDRVQPPKRFPVRKPRKMFKSKLRRRSK